jgi:hypothetical protein
MRVPDPMAHDFGLGSDFSEASTPGGRAVRRAEEPSETFGCPANWTAERCFLRRCYRNPEVYGKAGKVEDAFAAMAEALKGVEDTGIGFYEPELHRVKGELLLAGGPENLWDAEAAFRQAVASARRQRSKSLELRAIVSLCRLLQEQGKGDEARPMLAEIYGWFTEGFDTADLQEARALLQVAP